MHDYTELVTKLRSFAESGGDERCDACKYEEDYPPCVSCINRMVSDAADAVERRTAKWLHQQLVPNDITGHIFGECSLCHEVRIVDNYCPNCGADMREETDNG